jgi:hypothetical protein
MNYKVGDIVECLPGFKFGWDWSRYASACRDFEYGGAGYKPNRVFKISSISDNPIRGQILFSCEGNGGVYANALTLKDGLFIHKNIEKKFDFV